MKGVSAVVWDDVGIPAEQRGGGETNPAGKRVVDVKACNAADASPCGHG